MCVLLYVKELAPHFVHGPEGVLRRLSMWVNLSKRNVDAVIALVQDALA